MANIRDYRICRVTVTNLINTFFYISWDFAWAAGPTVRRWDQRTRNNPAYSAFSHVIDGEEGKSHNAT
jgi:hypothetical protein